MVEAVEMHQPFTAPYDVIDDMFACAAAWIAAWKFCLA
jgi:hypothetical protein